MILYENDDIVVIGTNKTANRKTGPMLQTWILVRRSNPVRAIFRGEDKLVCGDCYHRGARNRPRTCYVVVGHAPLGIWRKWKRGGYPKGTLHEFLQQNPRLPIRIGAYGDPGMLPVGFWDPVKEHRAGWTGYTHRWRTRPDLRGILMASTDNVVEDLEARLAGWRTFMVRRPDAVAADHITCPATTTPNVHCNSCQLCKGTTLSAPSISVEAHGVGAAWAVRETVGT